MTWTACTEYLLLNHLQVDSALTVMRGILAGKSLGDALVATRQCTASEYQFQFVKARNDYLQQVRPADHWLRHLCCAAVLNSLSAVICALPLQTVRLVAADALALVGWQLASAAINAWCFTLVSHSV